MMERLFPPALLDCISEGRPPQQHELTIVTDKVWHEAFRQCPKAQIHAVTFANVALVGSWQYPTFITISFDTSPRDDLP